MSSDYYIKNREKIIKRVSEYRKKHPEKRKIWYRNYYLKHFHQRNKGNRDKHKLVRTQLIDGLGNKCIRCSFSDIRALQIDHINGGGNKEYSKMGTGFYRYYSQHIKEAKKKLQILCANCNWIKKAENNENPKIKRNPE